MLLVNASLFPNLKTLEFKDLTFIFKTNDSLISFIENEQYEKPLLSPNLYRIKI